MDAQPTRSSRYGHLPMRGRARSPSLRCSARVRDHRNPGSTGLQIVADYALDKHSPACYLDGMSTRNPPRTNGTDLNLLTAMQRFATEEDARVPLTLRPIRGRLHNG